jgi:hypothetical protein
MEYLNIINELCDAKVLVEKLKVTHLLKIFCAFVSVCC